MDDEEMTTPKNPGDALAAFDKWLESRSLSTEKLDPKEWGHATYKHSHIQAMWEGWEASITPSPDYVMVPRKPTREMIKSAWTAQYLNIGADMAMAENLAEIRVNDTKQKSQDQLAYEAMIAPYVNGEKK